MSDRGQIFRLSKELKIKKSQGNQWPNEKGTSDLNIDLPLEERKMANKYLKKYLSSLEIEETKTKTTLRFDLYLGQNV